MVQPFQGVNKDDDTFRTLKLGSYFVLCFVFPTLADANDWTDRPYHAFGLADRGHDLRAEKEKDGVREIRTTGSDPYLSTVGLTEKIDPFTPYRVMFQYRSSTDLKNFQVLYQTPAVFGTSIKRCRPPKTGVGTLSN